MKKEEGKGKGERYTQLNAEFHRIARKDKAFLSQPCKEIEDNNRTGNTRDLFKKIRDTKGTKGYQRKPDIRGTRISEEPRENQRYQGNICISCKDGLSKGKKWQVPNRSRRD